MGAEERKVVAERMKTYWAKRRQQNTKKPREDSGPARVEDSTCDRSSSGLDELP
jgi:hypothetical protein